MTVGLPLKISAKIGCSSYSFLIDTGSGISILPYDPEFEPLLKPTAVSLTNASGDIIKTHGEINVQLDIRTIHRSFNWSFIVADVAHPILGVDFLVANSLLVDCKSRSLIDSITKHQIFLDNSNVHSSSYSIHTSSDQKIQPILNKYPILTSPMQLNDIESKPKPPVQHLSLIHI